MIIAMTTRSSTNVKPPRDRPPWSDMKLPSVDRGKKGSGNEKRDDHHLLLFSLPCRGHSCNQIIKETRLLNGWPGLRYSEAPARTHRGLALLATCLWSFAGASEYLSPGHPTLMSALDLSASARGRAGGRRKTPARFPRRS